MVYYYNSIKAGIKLAAAENDGYTIHLEWNKAYLNNRNFNLAYHIYMSTIESDVFKEGVKFIAVDTTETFIFDLTPGQLYHFAVRAVEYNPATTDINQIPQTFNNLYVYPESLLRSNIYDNDLLIPLIDTSGFPSTGIIKIGVELINYISVDNLNNNLILTNISQRGVLNTIATSHDTDGYDGYATWDPRVSLLLAKEETNTKILPCQSRFDLDFTPYTVPDGYRQETKDLFTSDLSGSDASNENFPTYDYTPPHSTSPNDLFSGLCIGSYIGGEMFCVDGYTGVGRVVRGLNLQEQNNQRQEVLLNLTGEPMCLIKKVWTGMTCDCYLPTSEHADDRCPKCYGKFTVGYEQFFNSRRSDGRILVRVSPYDDSVKSMDAGYESDATLDCWTLTVPTIKNRDILIRFDQDGNEEFRYEVLSVNRNKTILGMQGAQRFRMQRIRKFDPVYQIRVFRDTSTLPSTINTSITSAPGIPPHSHTIQISNNITMLTQINQTTGISQAHNHIVINGVVQPYPHDNHTHTIILP